MRVIEGYLQVEVFKSMCATKVEMFLRITKPLLNVKKDVLCKTLRADPNMWASLRSVVSFPPNDEISRHFNVSDCFCCSVSSARQIDLISQFETYCYTSQLRMEPYMQPECACTFCPPSRYPFLKRFLYAAEDPIKQKWPFVKEWSEQCQRNPQVTEKQLKVLRQRYGTRCISTSQRLIEHALSVAL